MWIEIKGFPDDLITEEAAEKIGLTLGFVDHVNKLNIKRGLKVRVRVLHNLCNYVKEAFGVLPFEFGSRRFPAKLQLKYNWTAGFCRLPSTAFNPFEAARNRSGGLSNFPKVSVSLLGIFVADLAVQLARFRFALVIEPISVPALEVVTIPASVLPAPSLVVMKRSAELALVSFCKRGCGVPELDQFAMVPYELPFAPAMALPHSGGTLMVLSAKKRKVGRPLGSKNKKGRGASWQALESGQLEPKRAKRRTFGARRALVLGEVVAGMVVPVLEAAPVGNEGEVEDSGSWGQFRLHL
ncbi:hypothetical protein ACLB2K_068316 [Fragaria x ananassa]